MIWGISLAALFAGGQAFARQTLIVTLQQESFAVRAQIRAEAEQLLKVVSGFSRLRGVEPMFTGSNRKVLEQIGQTSVAWAYAVHLENEEDAKLFERYIQTQQLERPMPPISVERVERLSLD